MIAEVGNNRLSLAAGVADGREHLQRRGARDAGLGARVGRQRQPRVDPPTPSPPPHRRARAAAHRGPNELRVSHTYVYLSLQSIACGNRFSCKHLSLSRHTERKVSTTFAIPVLHTERPFLFSILH